MREQEASESGDVAESGAWPDAADHLLGRARDLAEVGGEPVGGGLRPDHREPHARPRARRAPSHDRGEHREHRPGHPRREPATGGRAGGIERHLEQRDEADARRDGRGGPQPPHGREERHPPRAAAQRPGGGERRDERRGGLGDLRLAAEQEHGPRGAQGAPRYAADGIGDPRRERAGNVLGAGGRAGQARVQYPHGHGVPGADGSTRWSSCLRAGGLLHGVGDACHPRVGAGGSLGHPSTRSRAAGGSSAGRRGRPRERGLPHHTGTRCLMAGEKTEKATPKKRAEARKKGQVARSADLNGAVVLLAGLFALGVAGPGAANRMGDAMRQSLAQGADPAVVSPRADRRADDAHGLRGAVGGRPRGPRLPARRGGRERRPRSASSRRARR